MVKLIDLTWWLVKKKILPLDVYFWLYQRQYEKEWRKRKSVKV